MKPQAARKHDRRSARDPKMAPRLPALTLALAAAAGAASAGPGSVVIKTDRDITAIFGGQVRMIPTGERNRGDFGTTKATGDGRFKARRP